MGSRGRSSDRQSAEPNWTAVEVRDDAKAVLVAWTMLAVEEWHADWPRDDVPDIALTLTRWMRHWRRHPACDDLCREMAEVADRITRVVDRPPERSHLGPCPDCDRDLWADPGRAWAKCDCGAQFDVQATLGARRAWGDDALVTQAELARVYHEATVRTWIKRGQLTAHGDRGGKPAFRLGDARVLRERHAEARVVDRQGLAR
jgi:hypothetical protein